MMRTRKVAITLLLLVSCGSFAQRITDCLDCGWRFQDESDIRLPHTWNTDAYKTSAYDQGEKTYTRLLGVSAISPLRRYFLKIDAASKASSVFVNGCLAGTHKGGYTAHTLDITPYLHSGKDNSILIRVTNADRQVPPISADFTFMGGLYRHVWLVSTPLQHFLLTESGADRVRITPSDVSTNRAKLRIGCKMVNDDGKKRRCRLRHTVYAPDGSPLLTSEKGVFLESKRKVEVSDTHFAIDHPELWTPETPKLYRVVSELLTADGKTVLDREEHKTAFRQFRFDPEQGFFLNEKPYKLRGVNRHQDRYPYGVALTDSMHRKDMELIKRMGANFVRLAHYPQASAVLDACDSLGLLVWEEIPVINYVPDDRKFAENAADNLREMIRQHYNHPSIILWGYMNEILLRTRAMYKDAAALDSALTRTLTLARQLEGIVREEDPQRISVMALHGSDEYNKAGIADIPQVVGWNLYQGWYGGELTDFEKFLDRQHREHSSRPLIVSEWGAGSDLRLHSDKPKPFDFSMEYQQKYVEHYLPIIEATPYIAGGAYWNFTDFSSAERAESMPHINNKGLLTADRRVKDVYYYFQSVWRNDIPVVHIAARDWPDRMTTERRQTIKVYSNRKRVELLVNGKSLGTKEPRNCLMLFDVELAAGSNTLTAYGWDEEGQRTEDTAVIRYRQAPRPATSMPADRWELAINVGSDCTYRSPSDGLTWLPDRTYTESGWGYVGGEARTTQGDIEATEETPLYQTMRAKLQSYRFDVPPGSYEVTLHWADKPKKTEASAYLLGKESGDSYQAFTRTLRFTASTGYIAIDFSQPDMPQALSAITIRKL